MTSVQPTTLTQALWKEFGSALTMVESAITACPPQVWGRVISPQEFWYIAYHTLFWTDDYGSETTDGFRPPAPYTLGELDPASVLPERVYSKAELLDYVDHVMRKNRALIRRLPTLNRAASRHLPRSRLARGGGSRQPGRDLGV